MDRIAEKLGLDPCEFRLKNLIEAGMIDPSGATDLGEAHPKECILKGMELFDWERRRREIMSKTRSLRIWCRDGMWYSRQWI